MALAKKKAQLALIHFKIVCSMFICACIVLQTAEVRELWWQWRTSEGRAHDGASQPLASAN